MPKCLKETADQAPYRPRPDAPVSEVGYMKETEIGIAAVEEMTLVAFQQMEEQWGETGSPWRRFYEQVSALPDRVVAWNTNKEYTPEHIFFRSVDTGRLLAMDNGPFRVQVSKGRHQTGNDKVLLAGMIHELLLLRNFHDRGAGDIPIIVCNLGQAELNQALEYWVWLSNKGNTTHPDRVNKFNAIWDVCNDGGRNPCFYQLDLAIRKILAGVEYPVPPFVIIKCFSGPESPKAEILFTRSSAVPPQSVMQYWPNTCGGKDCDNPDCEIVRMPREGKEGAWILDPKGELLSVKHCESLRAEGQHWCNHWPCQEKQTATRKLLRCSQCKEVLYCSQAHQRSDWKIHKGLCIKGSHRAPTYNGPLAAINADGKAEHFNSWHDWAETNR